MLALMIVLLSAVLATGLAALGLRLFFNLLDPGHHRGPSMADSMTATEEIPAGE